MKKIVFISLSAMLVVGCHSHYDMTLNNGMKFTGISKPVLDKKTGVYHFKNATGKEQMVPATKVIEIDAK